MNFGRNKVGDTVDKGHFRCTTSTEWRQNKTDNTNRKFKRFKWSWWILANRKKYFVHWNGYKTYVVHETDKEIWFECPGLQLIAGKLLHKCLISLNSNSKFFKMPTASDFSSSLNKTLYTPRRHCLLAYKKQVFSSFCTHPDCQLCSSTIFSCNQAPTLSDSSHKLIMQNNVRIRACVRLIVLLSFIIFNYLKW